MRVTERSLDKKYLEQVKDEHTRHILETLLKKDILTPLAMKYLVDYIIEEEQHGFSRKSTGD